MRCECCGRALNDYESTLKGKNTGQYLDTCVKCLDGLQIETIGRSDLKEFEEMEEEDFEKDSDTEEYDK